MEVLFSSTDLNSPGPTTTIASDVQRQVLTFLFNIIANLAEHNRFTHNLSGKCSRLVFPPLWLNRMNCIDIYGFFLEKHFMLAKYILPTRCHIDPVKCHPGKYGAGQPPLGIMRLEDNCIHMPITGGRPNIFNLKQGRSLQFWVADEHTGGTIRYVPRFLIPLLHSKSPEVAYQYKKTLTIP